MIVEGRKKIGIVVNRVIDGRSQSVDKNELNAIIAPPSLVMAYFNDLYVR